MRILFLFLSVVSLNLQAQGYWQQEVNYDIAVELMPEANFLDGNVSIEYINNSPDVLNELYVHLWPNAYGNTESQFSEQLVENGSKEFFLSDADRKGFIFNMDFFVNDEQAEWKFNSNAIDIARIQLNTPLSPGESLQLSTPFSVLIPDLFSRMGRKDGQFNLTQWYPKIAMYDEEGWHPMSYLDQGEYYSNFGQYNVAITVPADYVVAATGVLTDEEEIQWLNRLENATRDGISDEYTFTVANDIKAERIGKKTVNYSQDNVTDFAFFASADYLLLKKPVLIAGETIDAQAFFTEEDVFLWEESALDNIEYALQFYSKKVGPYPYAHCTAVSSPLKAGGGMEYPMITAIAKTNNDLALKTVLIHEVGHNWFQGMLASNERRYPWMDEGINSFYEEWSLASQIGVKDLTFQESKVYYDLASSHHFTQEINSHSEDQTYINYYLSNYAAGAYVMNLTKEYLTEDVFNAAMQTFFTQWQYKHPSPDDLVAVLERVSGKSMSWFTDLINADTPPDYHVKSWQGDDLLVSNKSNVSLPFSVGYLNEDGDLLDVEWFDGFTGEEAINLSKGKADFHRLQIFPKGEYPELNRANNDIKASGGKGNGIEVVGFKSGIEGLIGSNEQAQIFPLPLIGWNATDQLMIGLGITNTMINEKPIEYTFDPMYAFGSGDIVGSGELRFNHYPDKGALHKIQPYVQARRFNFSPSPLADHDRDFVQARLGANFDFNKVEPRDSRQKRVSAEVKFNSVEPIPSFDVGTGIYTRRDKVNDYFIDVTYQVDNTRKFNPNTAEITVQHHADFTKTSASYKYRYDFAESQYFLKFRGFGGIMLRHDNTAPVRSYFTAMGRDAVYDYDFQHTYLDRTDQSDLANNLIYMTDGGLKLKEKFAFPVDVLGEWMGAMNVEATVPVDLPIIDLRVFADLVVLQPIDISSDQEINMLYDAGLSAGLGDFVRVYYPLAYSDVFKPDNDIEEVTFTDKLVFTVELNSLKWKDIIRKTFFNQF